jgi:L-aspartate oxidase
MRDVLQRVMTRDAGVLRDQASLDRAGRALAKLVPTDVEEANLLVVSAALVRAASDRQESRGTHTRADYPQPSSAFMGRFVFCGSREPELVPLPVILPEPSR